MKIMGLIKGTVKVFMGLAVIIAGLLYIIKRYQYTTAVMSHVDNIYSIVLAAFVITVIALIAYTKYEKMKGEEAECAINKTLES